MKKFYLFIFVLFFSLDCFAFEVSGTVTDKTGAPVSGARVTFENVTSLIYYSNVTDISGQFLIDRPTSVITPSAHNMLLFCYPNPFNRQTVISFHLDQKQRVELAVYNIVGQKMRVIFSGDLERGHHQYVWDGLSQQGAPVTPGMYFGSLQAKTSMSSVQMMVQGGENIAVPVWSSGEEQSSPKALTESSQIYNVTIKGDGFEDHYVYHVDMTDVTEKNFIIDRTVWTPFSTTGDYLGIYNGKDYTPFFIKGVNMGSSVPGTEPGLLAVSVEQYRRWFQMIADAGFNTIRIYTLHFPRFYEEFARYNRENPDKPLYLLHGIWLYEEYLNPVEQDDLYSFTQRFDTEIKYVIDGIHGNKLIPPRGGEAYGEYQTDISQWVIGYIIGREIQPIEVGMTNIIHRGVSNYTGAHVSIDRASPTETWAVEHIDNLIAYERANYQTTRPVAWSSWATLDPITHPSEESYYGYGEDEEQIDLNGMKLIDAPGGFFASYHAYPYYPHFMNWDYDDESDPDLYDNYGFNGYLGYLRQLRSHYTNFPLLITEFGVPSSYANARNSLSGMNHGGMTEKEQGTYNMRMLRNIYDTDCGGGVMFSWVDEWFKRTWITNPLVDEKRKLWHNICGPENNFGLLRYDPNPQPQDYNPRKTTNVNSSKISKVDMWHDFTFVNLEASLKTPLNNGDTLWIAFDTFKPDVGESTLPNGQKLIKNRAEFLLRITPDSANLYVTKAYNLLGLIFKLCEATSFQTKTTDGEPWQLFQLQYGQFLRWKPDFPYIQDLGKLEIKFGNGSLASHQTVQIKNDKIYIRIPWGFLHFTNPAFSNVIDDDESVELCKQSFVCGMQHLKAKTTDGINVTLIHDGETAELTTYKWEQWDVNSRNVLSPSMYIEVEKESLSIIREGLKNTPFTPKME